TRRASTGDCYISYFPAGDPNGASGQFETRSPFGRCVRLQPFLSVCTLDGPPTSAPCREVCRHVGAARGGSKMRRSLLVALVWVLAAGSAFAQSNSQIFG